MNETVHYQVVSINNQGIIPTKCLFNNVCELTVSPDLLTLAELIIMVFTSNYHRILVFFSFLGL